MTPKEKAEHLVDTYRVVLMQEDTDCGHECLCSFIAIKNALITVNEIELSIKENHDFSICDLDLTYWNDVRKELNKM